MSAKTKAAWDFSLEQSLTAFATLISSSWPSHVWGAVSGESVSKPETATSHDPSTPCLQFLMFPAIHLSFFCSSGKSWAVLMAFKVKSVSANLSSKRCASETSARLRSPGVLRTQPGSEVCDAPPSMASVFGRIPCQ